MSAKAVEYTERSLRYEFTDAEKAENAQCLARTLGQLSELENSQKAIKASLKEQTDQKKAEIGRFARLVRDGCDYKPVKGSWVMNSPTSGMKSWQRADNGEAVEERKMEPWEMQEELKLVLPAKEKVETPAAAEAKTGCMHCAEEIPLAEDPQLHVNGEPCTNYVAPGPGGIDPPPDWLGSLEEWRREHPLDTPCTSCNNGLGFQPGTNKHLSGLECTNPAKPWETPENMLAHPGEQPTEAELQAPVEDPPPAPETKPKRSFRNK